MLCRLILSQGVYRKYFGFLTVAMKKSFEFQDLEVIVVAVCGKKIKANYNLTSILPWHDNASKNLPVLAKQKYFCCAFVQWRKLGMWLE